MAPRMAVGSPPSSRVSVHADSEPLKRDWRVFAAQDADAGKDVDNMDAADLGACRAHCERYGLGGFVVHEGQAYFRWDSAEGLERRRQPAPGCALHLGFAWQVRQPLAAALHDEDGMPAVAGESVGLWLDPSDFIIATKEGNRVGVDLTVNFGIHGFPRNWPQVFSESSVLKKLLKKTGPCAAIRVSKVPSPSPEQRRTVEGVPLWPLQSFENALAVEAQTGMRVVRGFAVHDLFSYELGSAYVAEAYWWNAAAEGQWLDFTPRPEGAPELLLAEAADPPARPDAVLTVEQLVLAEGLHCLRFPGLAATCSVEMGTEGAVSLALRHAQLDAGRALCRAMVSGGMCSALVEHLSVRGNALASVRLLAVLTQCLQDQDIREEVWAPLHSMDVVWPLVRALSEASEMALAAASTLAHLCRASADTGKLALGAGAAQALADLFSRDDVKGSADPAAQAALALWEQQDKQMEETRSCGSPTQAAAPDWQSLLDLCWGDLQQKHQQDAPMERRGRSWARTIAFAQVALGARGVSIRRGTVEQPFVVWVLSAEDMVEAYLAEEGFFNDANWVDRAPTEVVIVGDKLRELSPSRLPAREGQAPVVRTASHEALRWLLRLGAPLPDLLAVLTPEAHSEGVSVPEEALALAAQVPALVSTRSALSESGAMDLRCKVRAQLLLPHSRCPFSSLAAGSAAGATPEDNAWALAVRGPQALGRALAALAAEAARARGPEARPPGSRVPCVFWGILDIKYDTSRPLLERVKVLETGDGQTSKFSGAGAPLETRYQEGYHKVEGRMDLHMYNVISNDKKWTHDRMETVGYGHIVPKQACYPRRHQPELAERIREDLGLREGEYVVLKLCNRSRAAGVVVTPLEELEDVLEDLLVPPKDLETWFEEGLGRMKASPTDLGARYCSFQEQQRHWWSNESPVFVAERWCRSTPVELESGDAVDATLRVAFVLRRQPRHQLQGPASSEELQVDWLGGYWKLSKTEGTLRDTVISAARTVGTADVCQSVLQDIYTALGDAVQGLFSEAEPSSAELSERYGERPELAAYFVGRLGTSHKTKDVGKAKRMLAEAEAAAASVSREQGRSCIQSYILRAQGVLEAQGDTSPERYLRVEHFFQQSLLLLPTNANSYCFLGLAALQGKRYHDAVENFSCSLLLDPDYKAPYVNLGATFLNLGRYLDAKQISEAGLSRHPSSPMCNYHIAVASCQLLFQLRDGSNGMPSFSESEECERLQEEAITQMQIARDHDMGRKRKKNGESPYHPADDQMLAAIRGDAPSTGVTLPEVIGWQFVSFRNM